MYAYVSRSPRRWRIATRGAELICRGHPQRWPLFRQASTAQPGRWSAPANPDRARHLGGNIIGCWTTLPGYWIGDTHGHQLQHIPCRVLGTTDSWHDWCRVVHRPAVVHHAGGGGEERSWRWCPWNGRASTEPGSQTCRVGRAGPSALHWTSADGGCAMELMVGPPCSKEHAGDGLCSSSWAHQAGALQCQRRGEQAEARP